MTDSKAFIDTNILVYAADGADIVKRDTHSSIPAINPKQMLELTE